MTKQEVIAQGDAACAAYRAKAKALVDRLLRSSGPEEQARLLRDLASAAETALQPLATVRPPPEGRQALDDFVIVANEQVAIVRRAAEELDEGDQASARALLGSALDAEAKLRAIARRYGFKACATTLDDS